MDRLDCSVPSGGRLKLLNFMWCSWPVGGNFSW